MGSVSPDIRIITRGKRDDTHFTRLDFQRKGESLECLFRHHPQLAQANGLTEPTRAFMVGYASHLLADELWILELYRPFFGNRDVFHDHLRGDLMDRALQLELDREEQLALGGLGTLHPLLVEAEENVEVCFIPSTTMCQWRLWVEGELDRSFTWDRLRFMARRIISRDPNQAETRLKEMVEQFLGSVPQGLETIYQAIPRAQVEAFREKSIEEMLKFAREYLR